MPDADYVICESTYGDRIHESRKDRRQRLQAICEHAFEVLLSCPAGRFTIHLRSYVVGRGSAVVAVGELGLATSRSAAA